MIDNYRGMFWYLFGSEHTCFKGDIVINFFSFMRVSLLIMSSGVIVQAGSMECITLASNSQSKVDIIIPADASSGEVCAATELKTYLDQITCAKFRVQKDSEKIAGFYISIGNTVQSQAAGFDKIPATLGDEGIAVKLSAGNVFLLGGEHGIMNAVITFLEENLGCRWYSHQWKLIPKNENLKVDITDRISIPDFQKRFVFTATAMSSTADWTRHNRVMQWNKFDHVDGWFCHTYDNICPMSEFATNSELFAKDSEGTPFNTQICPTHPEIIRRAKERVIAALEANKRKDATVIAIAENDGLDDFCHCERCEQINADHQSPIAAHLTLVNEVARTIKQDYPDYKVEFIVYSKYFRKPPINMKMEPNIAMWFCANNIDVNEKYRKNKIAVEEFDKWKALVGTVYVWEYGCDYSNYFRVVPSLSAKIDNLRYWHENGVDGIMFQEVFGAHGGDQQALRAWILSKMLWNSKLDPDTLALDFCKGVFGNAAPEMYEYYQLVKQAGTAEKSVEEYYGKAEFIAKANQIFAKAFAKVDKDGNNELHNRIDVQYVPIAFMEIKSIFQSYPDNKDNFPAKRFNRLLKEIKKITKREEMGGYSELIRMSGYIDELELLEKVQKSGVLWIYAINGALYEYPIKKDPLAANGIAPLLPCNDKWLVQWRFPANLCIPGRKYQLRVQLRPVNDSSSDFVAAVGVYFKPTKQRSKEMSDKKSFTEQIDGIQLSSEEYRWISVGKPFIPEKDSYIWFSAAAGSKIKGLFVDKIEMIPQQ